MISPNCHSCDGACQDVQVQSQICIEEWDIYHRNTYRITLNGTKATVPVVLTIKHETDVLCILFGGYWMFRQS